jgi:hypothetical protein
MTSLHPKYIPLVQKPECCAVACFQMILFRNGFGLYDPEKLAKYFDVRVSTRHQSMFTIRLQTLSKYNFDEGINTLDSINKINAFFRKNRISLVAEAKRISEIENLMQFIRLNLF